MVQESQISLTLMGSYLGTRTQANMKKSLPDLDKGHPFYSEESTAEWKIRIKRLVKEEEEMIAANRQHYKDRHKKEEKELNGDKDLA